MSRRSPRTTNAVRPRVGAPTLAAIALAASAWLLLAARGENAGSWFAALDVLRRAALAAAILGAGGGVGWAMARALTGGARCGGRIAARGAFGAALSTALGLAALGWGALLFGAFGFASTRGLTLLFLLFAVASLAVARGALESRGAPGNEKPNAAGGAGRADDSDSGAVERAKIGAPAAATRDLARGGAFGFAAPLSRVPFALLAGMVALFAIAAFAPPAAYDVLEYHLGGPVGWLEARSLAPARGNFYTALPSSLEAAYALALALSGQALPKLLHFAVLLAWLAACARAFRAMGVHDARLRAAGLLLLLAFPATFESASDANNDLAVALFHALAFVALAEGWGAGRAGLLAGIGVGFKFTMLTVGVGPLGAALVALALARPGGVRAKELAMDVARFAAGAAIGFAPWALRAWWFTGYPLFPSTALALPSPGVDAAAGLVWNDALAAEYLAVHLAKAPWSAAYWEQWFARLGQWGWGWVAMIAAGLAMGAWAWRRDGAKAERRAGAAALAALAGSAAWSLLGSSPQRFLIPLLPLATGCMLLAARRGVELIEAKGIARRGGGAATLAAAISLLALPQGASILYSLDRFDMAEAALHPEPAWPYQKAFVGWGDAPFLETLEEARDLAEAADAPPVRLFALFEARTAHLPVAASTVTVHDAFPPEWGSLAKLRAAGFTHLLVNEVELERLRRFYPTNPARRARRVGDEVASPAAGSPRTIPGRAEFYADWLPWSGPANAASGVPPLAAELVEARGRATLSSEDLTPAGHRVWLLDLR